MATKRNWRDEVHAAEPEPAMASSTGSNWRNQVHGNEPAPVPKTTSNWRDQIYHDEPTVPASRTTQTYASEPAPVPKTTSNWRDQIYTDEPTNPAPKSSSKGNWRDNIYDEPVDTAAPVPNSTSQTTKPNWRDQVHQSEYVATDVEKSGLQAKPVPVRDDDGEEYFAQPPTTAMDLVTEVIHATDDPTLNPWTFRTFLLGMILSIFGGTLASIFYFKPQPVTISTIFLAVISYVLGKFLELVIPRKGAIGRFLNPHPFNSKEHAAIIVMGSAAANAPLAMEVLAVQKLFYDVNPHPLIAILLIWSSQCVGYGFAGLMRRTLVFPTKMLYPYNLPITSMLEALHGDKKSVQKKLRVFYIGFIVLFCYEVLPIYIMPVLVGVSAFCLANQDSLLFTNVFGGSNGNEGLGVLSWSFDWQYIANPSPLWYPLQTLVNNFVGYCLCVLVFLTAYYGNVWDAKKFPFLSQSLFSDASNGTSFPIYDQKAILDDNLRVDPELVAKQGLPYFTTTFALYILATNLSITATFSHLLLWNYDDLKGAWQNITLGSMFGCLNPANWKFWKTKETNPADDKETDPHYRLMLAYKDTPNWWYGAILVVSLAIGMIMIYKTHSTLPWWSFLFASIVLSPIFILFFGAMFAITGFQYNVQPVVQMLAGYIHPGRPMANMYFVLFGYNSVVQGQLLLRDLKFGQYAHLAPRATFTMQLIGTFIGSIASYSFMSSITTSQRETLLAIEGSKSWSGQSVQMFNSQAVAWGGFSHSLFSAGKRYQWVTWAFLLGFLLPFPFWIAHKFLPKWRLDYWNTALIANYIGLLNIGVNSVTTPWFAIGAFSQFYLRKYRTNWFVKYNYVLSAAMEGGTHVMVFILAFAVNGAAGKERKFPPYWGNNYQNDKANLDYCKKSPGSD